MSYVSQGLTWTFAFLVMIPHSTSINYLSVVFTTIYCVLNVCFGIFLLISCVLLVQKAKRSTRDRQSTSPAPKSQLNFKTKSKAVAPSPKAENFSARRQIEICKSNPRVITPVGENNYKLTTVIDKLTEQTENTTADRKKSPIDSKGKVIDVSHVRNVSSGRSNNVVRVSRLESGNRTKSITPIRVSSE